MKLRELVEKYRLDNNLSQRQFAKQCGVSNGYISILEEGVNPRTNEPLVPTIATLKKISNAMGLSLHELMTMVDDMPIKMTNEAEKSSLPDNIISLPKHKKLPMLGEIACGEPIFAEENIDGYISCPDNIDADFCLRCKGDSMIGARIQDGDIVYIRQQPDVENGEIAAVLIDNEATLKRVYKKSESIILQPENPAYEPLIFVREEMNDIRILGKAVCFLSRVR